MRMGWPLNQSLLCRESNPISRAFSHYIYWAIPTPNKIFCQCNMGYLSWYSDQLQAGRSGFDSWQWQKIFLYSSASRSALRATQPRIQCVTGALSPGVKRSGSEADHPTPSSVEIKNSGAIPPFFHTSSWPSANVITHKDNFTPTSMYHTYGPSPDPHWPRCREALRRISWISPLIPHCC
jgi:hypothetical protein